VISLSIFIFCINHQKTLVYSALIIVLC